MDLEEIDSQQLSANPNYADWCLGQVVQSLIDTGDEQHASLLLGCKLRWWVIDQVNGGRQLEVLVSGPIAAIKTLKEESSPLEWAEHIPSPAYQALTETAEIVLGPYISVVKWGFKVDASNLPPNWRQELLEIVRKKGTTNQGHANNTTSGVRQYANLRFRSESEISIARALDKARVMYFANCTARVSQGQDRLNREPDFLICHHGKWGILEVDGEPFHPPSRTVHDHERDRLFEQHGIKFVQHYDADRCYEEPVQVVTEFLQLLAKNG